MLRSKMLRSILALAFAAFATVASAQQYMPLPPNSVIGNVFGQSNPANAITFPQLASQLMLHGGLVQGPTSSTAGHPAVFGSTPNVLVDGGAIAGTGTVTAVTCGAGLSGGTFNVTGTCALNATITPQGRLTLASAAPVMTTSVAGATSVVYTNYVGNLVPIYDGTNFVPTAFSEVSQATSDATKSPTAVAPNSVYDLFVWNDGGTIRCTRGPAWTNSTTRSAGTALTSVNGMLVNNASITNGPAANRGTYVGTIASNGSSTIDYVFGSGASGGSAAFLGVWNAYNRVSTQTAVNDTGTTYNYGSATIRLQRASAGMEISFVRGLNEDAIQVNYGTLAAPGTAAQVFLGIGLDTTSSFTSQTATSNLVGSAVSTSTGYSTLPGIGLHFVAALEQASTGTVSFFPNSSNVFSFVSRN
ncbi:hypothetical protein [Bradyrhizobium cytisi]|uniref:Uncharacterized protein n=1 Tax=Bradyrhizobium cytisi TaxID=515489 RepID=A0A5S4X197_9BRAD|nr:hypothetical protein [Bradyrhizobium cytisi]TYL87789.1 hypothetical protein FXB38_03145 [Bradyrhizobium cytisi]